jgi:hypothetical protein
MTITHPIEPSLEARHVLCQRIDGQCRGSLRDPPSSPFITRTDRRSGQRHCLTLTRNTPVRGAGRDGTTDLPSPLSHPSSGASQQMPSPERSVARSHRKAVGWHAQRLCDGRGGALLAEIRRRSAVAGKHPGRSAQHHAMFASLPTLRSRHGNCCASESTDNVADRSAILRHRLSSLELTHGAVSDIVSP